VVLLTGRDRFPVADSCCRLLEQKGVALPRPGPETVASYGRVFAAPPTDSVARDVLDPPSLAAAMHGVATAYYLARFVPPDPGSKISELDDRQSADDGASLEGRPGAAIIYLGGLGDDAVITKTPHNERTSRSSYPGDHI